MSIMEKALRMLGRYPLCDHCLGRQFALLGYGLENDERGRSVKLALMMHAHAQTLGGGNEGVRTLKALATNGFLAEAEDMLKKMNKRISKTAYAKKCVLCEDKFRLINRLLRKAEKLLNDYEHQSFLVGIELPGAVEEGEDEFRAEFEVNHGESLRNEFSRLIGKKLGKRTGKTVEFRKPEIVVVVNPMTGSIRLQVNPLFIEGRYRKLLRGIPQSKWFCSNCHGKGCAKCDWTGKMYPESVEEIVEKPILEVTGGVKGSFHASGREDIDARMLGSGRPFVVEITTPRKRLLNLDMLEEAVNAGAAGKIEVTRLRFADRDAVRRLKKAESTQKEYRVSIEFEKQITAKDLKLLNEKLMSTVVRQKTPNRVLHRRADLTREKYIYDVNVKKVSSRKAIMRVRCQGGLYVKELVSGDEGRTTPSVTELLNNRAKPIKLDVLNIIMAD
jgi:tRNA pseudouridine synthase 10